jgi:hypothetical protein
MRNFIKFHFVVQSVNGEAPHLYRTSQKGRAMAQAVSRRPLFTAVRVCTQVNPVGFVVDKVALGQAFLRVLRFSPVSIIPPWAPIFRKLKKKNFVHSFIHSFITPSFIHSHPGTDKRPVKAAAVQ